MSILVRRSSGLVQTFFWSLLWVMGCGLAQAQTKIVTPLDKQLAKMDGAISAIYVLNSPTSGTNYLNAVVTNQPSNTVGALLTLRYTAKPYFGLEFNFGYARYTQGFNLTGGVQSNADEYTLGYVVHPKTIFGAKPFLVAGTGVTEFKPTRGGGQGYLPQARQSYYYAGGVDVPLFGSSFSARAQFRQTIQLAPDFQQNYLTILKHTRSTEPAFGFVYHF